MIAQIMCTACRGAGGWGCGKDAVRCEPCQGTGEVDAPALPGCVVPSAIAAAKEGA